MSPFYQSKWACANMIICSIILVHGPPMAGQNEQEKDIAKGENTENQQNSRDPHLLHQKQEAPNPRDY